MKRRAIRPSGCRSTSDLGKDIRRRSTPGDYGMVVTENQTKRSGGILKISSELLFTLKICLAFLGEFFVPLLQELDSLGEQSTKPEKTVGVVLGFRLVILRCE